jgi:hypothetical protein
VTDRVLSEGACSGDAQAWQDWRFGDAGASAAASSAPAPSRSPSGPAVGRLACYSDERGRAVVSWTVERDRVLLTAARNDGDRAQTHDWWAR